MTGPLLSVKLLELVPYTSTYSRMEFNVIGTNGPLFVLSESAEETTFLSTHYPQFAKRSLGWQLSVEEICCLQTSVTAETAASAPSTGVNVSVNFTSAEAAERYNELQRAYAMECLIYCQLTLHHRYKLRHGSAFGANYIGYQDLRQHGEYLFFTCPLTDLEQVRASRVAHSVGKTAVMVVVAAADETNVTLVPLSRGRNASGLTQARKLRRKE